LKRGWCTDVMDVISMMNNAEFISGSVPRWMSDYFRL
jgi:hypothetical protein